MGEIVARGTAKHDGGRCRKCNCLILKGNTIFKLAGIGKTTRHGNGPGNWVCGPCAYREEGPK